MTGSELLSVGRAAGPVLTGISRFWRWWRPDVHSAALDSSATDLADVVAEVETRRLAELGVARDRGVAVHWRTVTDAADDKCESGTLEEVGQFFDTTPNQRMVVLGAPGAGKTVTALHLLLHLLDQRKLPEHARGPVPLRVNAASWDPTAQSVTEWIAQQLATDYSVRLPVARKIVRTRRLLVVLDGVDEMDSAEQQPVRARAALEQLNSAHWLDSAMVLTCRTDAYNRIRELRGDAGLHDATVLELQPLRPDHVLDYLEQRRLKTGVKQEKWTPIEDVLRTRPSGPLSNALSSPWILSVVPYFLRNASQESIAELAAAENYSVIEDLIFSALIPFAVAALPLDAHGNRKYSENQVSGWLKRIARDDTMGNSSSGSGGFGLVDIWKLAGQRQCRLLHCVLAFVAVMSIGWWVSVMLVGWDFGGFVVWIFISAYCGIRGGSTKQPAARTKKWRTYGRGDWRRWIRAAVLGFASGATMGIIMYWPCRTAGSELSSGISPTALAVVFGSVFGASVLLAAGLTGHRQPQLDEKRVIRDDITAAIYTGMLMWIITAGILCAVLALSKGYPLWSIPIGAIIFTILVVPLGVFITTMLILARAKASVRYLAAKILFALRSDFAVAPGPFLDWARGAGLLRVTGAAYQFRHLSYQRWLAGKASGSCGAPDERMIREH